MLQRFVLHQLFTRVSTRKVEETANLMFVAHEQANGLNLLHTGSYLAALLLMQSYITLYIRHKQTLIWTLINVKILGIIDHIILSRGLLAVISWHSVMSPDIYSWIINLQKHYKIRRNARRGEWRQRPTELDMSSSQFT